MFVSALDYECKARKGNGGKKQIVGIVFLRLDYDKPLQGRGSIFSLLKRGWVGGKLDQRIKRKKNHNPNLQNGNPKFGPMDFENQLFTINNPYFYRPNMKQQSKVWT